MHYVLFATGIELSLLDKDKIRSSVVLYAEVHSLLMITNGMIPILIDHISKNQLLRSEHELVLRYSFVP